MTREDILALARLARINLSPEELERFTTEIPAVLNYVSAIKAITKDAVGAKVAGPRFNIFRSDEVTNEPESYTKDLLAAMPNSEGRFMKVQKILNNPQ